VLAVASGSDSQLELAGLVALADPPRPDSAELISELRRRGVRVLLVTGDGEATARAIAGKVGITGPVAPAGTLHEGLDPETAGRFEVFAGVLPEGKFVLVQALQQAGHVVGMTGDGVNDAPALRQADVGIAVAASTDVAKAAASLVLTRPGLGEILAAVDGSRRIHQRLKTWVLAMVTRKLGIPPFLALGVLVLGVFVLSPLLMVLFMFTGDVATFALSMDKVTPSPGPDRWLMRPLARTGLALAALLLVMSGVVYWVGRHPYGLSLHETQTLVFVWLVFAGGQSALYTTRSRRFFWTKPYPCRWLLGATLLDVALATVLATQGWLMSPISIGLVALMLGFAAAYLIAADLLKITLSRLTNSPARPPPPPAPAARSIGAASAGR
jgi:H+-transporting ATPase